MLKRTHSSWRAHVAGRFGVPVALLGLVTGVAPLTATVGAHAGTMQSYIVLYSASVSCLPLVRLCFRLVHGREG